MSKEIKSTQVYETSYRNRVSSIEKYQSNRIYKKLFTIEAFILEWYDVFLEYCYTYHRTLFTKQTSILRKIDIKPKKQMEDPEKVIVCHSCFEPYEENSITVFLEQPLSR